MSSSIGPAYAALFDLASGAAGFAGVQVTDGPPGDHEAQEVVALLDLVDGDEEPRVLGNLMMEETYGIEVGIKAHHPSSTSASEVRARVTEMRDVLYAALAQDVSLGSAVRTALPSSFSLVIREAEGGGWVGYARVVIDCVARVSLT